MDYMHCAAFRIPSLTPLVASNSLWTVFCVKHVGHCGIFCENPKDVTLMLPSVLPRCFYLAPSVNSEQH